MDDKATVFKFIDDFYRHSSRLPKMYFRSPESCEEVVSLLERLRDTLIGEEHEYGSSCDDYLVANGFGSASHYTRYVLDHPEASMDADLYFAAYFDLLGEYLETQGRHLTGPEDEFSRSRDDRG